ncbi:TetR/AcrR family transcriptional regulator [Gordonia aichiensis]|uniref:TetR/AcrR family transcriptional regulator n=1 Tax=Gordonia aichiensis TaxID=36820 RepID=UPI003266C8EC
MPSTAPPDPTRPDPVPSRPLRSRQRSRVRREIQVAAWRLFVDSGFAVVTTKQIAAAAGVSESTYFRHVSSKDDLLLRPLEASSAAIVARFAARPADADVTAALTDAIVEQTDGAASGELGLWRAALASAPELHGRIVLIPDDDVGELIRLARERMGVDPESLAPGVAVHAVLGAVAYAYRLWIDGTDRELSELIRTATECLQAAPNR